MSEEANMRLIGTWMILILGGLCLTITTVVQASDDEEQGTMDSLVPSSTGEAALAQALDDEGQGRDHRAPGVHVWVGRHPSNVELHSAITQARSQAKSLTPAVSDAPDFQNERVKSGWEDYQNPRL